MNCNDELIIKCIGKISLEFPELDQLKLRRILEEAFYGYDVLSKETALVASDIEEKIQIYLAVKKLDGLSRKTLDSYELNLMSFANFIRKPIATVTTMDIRMYLAVRCKNLKGTTTNTHISTLKSFFGWLSNEEYIPKDPTKKIKHTKEPKRLRHALTEEEIELLRQACKTDREKALIEFLVSSGARLSEVIGVNKDKINWYEMSLNVIGKGNKERKIYFSIKAKILLQKYLSARKDECPALFVTGKYPHQRMGSRSVEREINNIAIRAGFDKSIYPHLFRHSFATHKLNSGMPLVILQKLMGHDSPETTLVYSEISEENIKHEYKKFQ
ncbi:tyrosine-type recombinase/integrase [Clostridium sp. CX1]|uniref:tyrosine-type recombinase/integrase n=1 Tax=Clostridium sp. CX1 TaxID=2978346 RepID=UPI0021BE24B6|nr:tyrosine-type recombinase/integrase [Clostridium sp. CX1]MCT8975481.1 tyrosine-type recombinase/integrase [Clostridium sp. CX1]